ncbi:MAG: low molecular weight protein-tyrosine-phosphatase [Pseudomonadota bacterium]
MVNAADQSLSVLFVCLGNICRSPMAEGAFRKAAEEAGLACDVASAGTAGYHIGEPPDPRAIATARANGVDIAEATGRQLQPEDYERFTHIFALDTANLAGITSRAPRRASARISLMMDALPGRKGETVKDPYYGDESDFAKAWDDIAKAVDVLVERFKTDGVSARF